MLNIYQDIRDEDGGVVSGRTKLFIKETLEDGSIDLYMSGLACIPETSGTLFIVDEYIIEQIEKVQFVDGVLSVKDSEELTVPEKTEEEIEREQLLARLAELDAQ